MSLRMMRKLELLEQQAGLGEASRSGENAEGEERKDDAQGAEDEEEEDSPVKPVKNSFGLLWSELVRDFTPSR